MVKTHSFLHFWLGNVFRATAACTFSTSGRQKVVRTCGAFAILTWKCASRHNGAHFFDIAPSKSRPTLVCSVHFAWKCASRHSSVHFFDIATSKSGPNLACFVHFDLETCFAPRRLALLRHLNFQKWSEPGVLCTFWLDFLPRWTIQCKVDVLITMRSAIFPLHLSKVLRLPRKSDAKSDKVLHLSREIKPDDLTLRNATPLRKSAPWPRNISDQHVSCTVPATRNASLQILFKCPTPAIVFASATKPSRFAHFWQGAQSLAPALPRKTTYEPSKVVRACRALNIFTYKCASRDKGVHFFDISKFQKWSGNGVLCTFWLRNALRCASRHNGVQFFISHLASWLRTRRLSEPPLRPARATNHWKNTVNRDFPTFSRPCTFFLPWSAHFFSSPLWLFPPLLFQLSILSEVSLLNFLRLSIYLSIYLSI